MLLCCAELAKNFPDGVYELKFGQPGGGDSPQRQVANNKQLLLACLTHNDALANTEPRTLCQDPYLASQLVEQLRGRKCLLLLDDVRGPSITEEFLFEGFKGKLLVTGLSAATAWQDASPEGRVAKLVHISSGGDDQTDRDTPSAAEQRHAFELQLLAMRSSGGSRLTIPPDFQVVLGTFCAPAGRSQRCPT